MTSVFNTDASLPYNHGLFESPIVKKRIKMDGEGTYCCLTAIIPSEFAEQSPGFCGTIPTNFDRLITSSLKNPGLQMAAEANLVEYPDDIISVFEKKAQVFLDELAKVMSSFGVHFAPTNCKDVVNIPENFREIYDDSGSTERRQKVAQLLLLPKARTMRLLRIKTPPPKLLKRVCSRHAIRTAFVVDRPSSTGHNEHAAVDRSPLKDKCAFAPTYFSAHTEPFAHRKSIDFPDSLTKTVKCLGDLSIQTSLSDWCPTVKVHYLVQRDHSAYLVVFEYSGTVCYKHFWGTEMNTEAAMAVVTVWLSELVIYGSKEVLAIK
ncbi:hypothetical protein CLF_112064 [Clonorchis sinensis]|uniref:Uncharacterized protein n=1 Tax=Clonorchis sinensis TaxID=79923 RepID=G7YVS4_CLOSI|nr:hypothetical protein CLF_112064 [Clonorchis sinensis]